MTDLHRRFDDWLAGGAHGDPPRDLALHAAGCDGCLRAIAAIDSLSAIDIDAASLPPLRALAAGTSNRARTLRYAVGAAAVVLLVTSVAIGGSGLLRPTQRGSSPELGSPGAGVLAGEPSARATPRPVRGQPSSSASTSSSPSPSVSEEPPAAAVATAAPVLAPPPWTPAPQPPGTPQPAATPVPSAAPTAAPSVSATAIPSATASASESASPSVLPSPQCSNGIDDDGDGVFDFGGVDADPGCSDASDDSEADA